MLLGRAGTVAAGTVAGMIAAIELGILQVLKAAGESGVLGYEYVLLDTFPDEFEEYLGKARNLRTPAAWTAFLGMGKVDDSDDDAGPKATLRFALVVGSQNLRNEQETRHGDGALPGSYQLARDAVVLLSRSMLELDLVKPVAVRGGRLVNRSAQMAKQGLSLIAIELECEAAFGGFDPGDLGDFTSFHVDWDVPAHGNVALPLPSASPDAADLIEVPNDAA